MSFLAKYSGTCSECEERISPGDEVHYVEDQIAHVRCESFEHLDRPVEVCDSCWLTKPCDCE